MLNLQKSRQNPRKHWKLKLDGEQENKMYKVTPEDLRSPFPRWRHYHTSVVSHVPTDDRPSSPRLQLSF